MYILRGLSPHFRLKNYHNVLILLSGDIIIELQFIRDMSINYCFTLTSYNQLLQYLQYIVKTPTITVENCTMQ